MKTVAAILITLGLAVGCWILSSLVFFDFFLVVVLVTSIWAAFDSSKIELHRYKLGLACKPISLFCLLYLFWIFIFPWYLWARLKVLEGSVELKDSAVPDLSQRPFRRFFHKLGVKLDPLAQWLLIGLVGFKILFMGWWYEENWRGQRVWNDYRHELEAKGQNLNWDALIPPPVPDSQNIFSAPMMSSWFVNHHGAKPPGGDFAGQLKYNYPTSQVQVAELVIVPPGYHPTDDRQADTIIRYDDPVSHYRAKEAIQKYIGPYGLGVQGAYVFVAKPPQLDPSQLPRLLLETSQKPGVGDLIFYLSHGNPGSVVLKPDGTNAFRVETTFCPAADYLKWSDQFAMNFEMVREALKRPYARMDGDYSSSPNMPLPNFTAVRALAQTLAQRAECYMLLGQPDKALQELTLLYDSRRLLEGAPTGKPMTLVAAMINVAVTGLYVDAIADGFRLHAWNEPQLVALQNQLAEINLAPYLKESFRGEEASMTRIVENILLQNEPTNEPNATLWQKMKAAKRYAFIRGFMDLNLVNVIKLEQPLVETIDLTNKVVLMKKAAEAQQGADELMHASKWQIIPYKLMAMIAVPNFSRAFRTFAFHQTKADEAQIVCALERYRLAHSQYPETLNALAPQFIDSTNNLPHDIIGGQPLKYHRTNDGRFVLYSIGWDETDDGGQFSSFDYGKGDWIW